MLLMIAALGYGGYRYWRSLQLNEAFCEKLAECMPGPVFMADFGDVEQCSTSEEGAQAMEDFAACDLDMDCAQWEECGYGIGANRLKDRKGDHETNFDQVAPYL